MAYDQFEIKAELRQRGSKDSRPEGFYMEIKIFINGKDLSGDDWIDPERLELSLPDLERERIFGFGETNECMIVNCSCGIYECGGYYAGIKVAYFKDYISWQVPNPLTLYGLPEDERDNFKVTPSLWRYDAYRFERNAFIQAAEKAIAEVKSYCNLKAETEKNPQ